jgi:hypothetical protein
MNSKVARSFLMALLTMLACPGWAGLFLADHSVFGTGSLTYDSGQGLYWLQPGFTAGQSYLQIQALLSSDPGFLGFRVASANELNGLYAASLIPDINFPGYGALYGTTANVEPVRALQALVGVTYSVTSGGVPIKETAGYVGTPYVSPINGFLSVDIGNLVVRQDVATPFGASSFASAYTQWGSVPVSSEVGGVGAWLVSAAPAKVPEPAALILVVTGLLIMAWLRARRELPTGLRQGGSRPM